MDVGQNVKEVIIVSPLYQQVVTMPLVIETTKALNSGSCSKQEILDIIQELKSPGSTNSPATATMAQVIKDLYQIDDSQKLLKAHLHKFK